MWPAGRRPDDNLPAAGQPNSRVRARRCIQRPEMVRWARGRARKVKRWRRTCARTSSPPPNSSPNLCPAWKPGCGDAESNHAGPPTDRDRCAAVDTPEDGLPDALSARQAYGKPLYHGLGGGSSRRRSPSWRWSVCWCVGCSGVLVARGRVKVSAAAAASGWPRRIRDMQRIDVDEHFY